MNEWTIEYYHRSVRKFIDNLPVSILADYTRLASMLKKYGADLRLPYSRAMGDGLFELRPKGKEGIARIFYCMMIEQ